VLLAIGRSRFVRLMRAKLEDAGVIFWPYSVGRLKRFPELCSVILVPWSAKRHFMPALETRRVLLL